MSDENKEKDKPGKLINFVGKFDFLSIIAIVLILALLLSRFVRTH
jgi:flagellar biogenesis protein FliO